MLLHCTAAPAPQNMTAGDDCTFLESAKQKRARLRGETQKDIADVKKIDALEESDVELCDSPLVVEHYPISFR